MLNQNKCTDIIAYRNSGNCPYTQSFGAPRLKPFQPNGKSASDCRSHSKHDKSIKLMKKELTHDWKDLKIILNTVNAMVMPGHLYQWCNLCNQGRPEQVRGPMQELSAGPNARPRRGAPLSSVFVTSSCSVDRFTIVVERRCKALTRELSMFANVRKS